jgi:hypothetical protein
MKQIPKKNIEQFVTMLAFHNEIYPSINPETNLFWAKIRKNHETDCLKYGKCDICNEEGLLIEYMLNWICINNKNCHNKIKAEYKIILKEWHNNH